MHGLWLGLEVLSLLGCGGVFLKAVSVHTALHATMHRVSQEELLLRICAQQAANELNGAYAHKLLDPKYHKKFRRPKEAHLPRCGLAYHPRGISLKYQHTTYFPAYWPNWVLRFQS